MMTRDGASSAQKLTSWIPYVYIHSTDVQETIGRTIINPLVGNTRKNTKVSTICTQSWLAEAMMQPYRDWLRSE